MSSIHVTEDPHWRVCAPIMDPVVVGGSHWVLLKDGFARTVGIDEIGVALLVGTVADTPAIVLEERNVGSHDRVHRCLQCPEGRGYLG